MGCFTLKIQITFFSRVPHTSLCVPLGVRVPQFGKHCSTAITQTDRQTDPQQVSGDVALLVPTAGPPPLCLLLVLPAQDGHAVPLPEGQLVLSLHLIVPQAIHHPSVHDAHLLLLHLCVCVCVCVCVYVCMCSYM